ncbi:MAG: tripartite tricarboxylate transporter TctB family protein [Clostridia bacterium]|nr:tripartite tricarboxylate transporter TctB family protein [Clostridia bacterium]
MNDSEENNAFPVESAEQEKQNDANAVKQPGETPVKKLLWIRQLLPAAFILMSIVWIYQGLTKFGFFDRLKGGTPAFMPILCASVMLVASVIALIRSFKEEKPVFHILCFIFLLLGGALIYLTKLIGLLPSLLIFVFIWVKVIEKSSWRSTLIVVGLMALIGYGLFQAILNVPFPNGLIYDTLFY